MSLATAQKRDQEDSLRSFRSKYVFPKTTQGKDFLYFCGNSLGLQASNTKDLVINELNKWQSLGVEGHFSEDKPWLSYHKLFEEGLSKFTGALPSEVVAMNALSVNLNLLLLSFYQPTKTKFKIAIERNAFPSDQYAVKSLVDLWHQKGLLTSQQAQEALVFLEPDAWGVYTTDHLQEQLTEEVALLLLSGVNYQTGQVFELEKIASHCQQNQIVCGLDLAHAIGNIPLNLHNWEVDFAVWCSYKYLNGGPGAVGGAFIHQKHHHNTSLPKLQGWWSNKEENRFEMNSEIDPYQTAEQWQMSNAPVFNMLGLLAHLEQVKTIDLQVYYQKGQALSSFIVEQLQKKLPQLQLITPLECKGCQISLFLPNKNKEFVTRLKQNGIIADWRKHPKGGILRLAPVPIYNNFEDCYTVVEKLKMLI
jgi:kynureninase